MKNLILLSLILTLSPDAFAKCDLKKIEIGKSFSSLKEDFNFDDDFESSKEFTSNTKGKYLCDELTDTEVSSLFINKNLAQLQIKRRSSESKLLEIAVENFGAPKELPNKEDPNLSSYSTFWDNGKTVVAYNFSYSNKNYIETLSIQGKDFAEDISKANSVYNDKKE